MAHPQFEAVNLISDPIHGYIELTKRLTPEQSGRAGPAPPAGAGGGRLGTPPPPTPPDPLVVETLRMAGLLHDVGHGPFAHFFDEHVLARFPAPPHPSRDPAKRLSHEDRGLAIIERQVAENSSGGG